MSSWQETAQLSLYRSASVSMLGGTIYLIEGYSSFSDTLAPIYQVSMNGSVRNTNLVLFKSMLEDDFMDLATYYDMPRTVCYLKRKFKTVYEIVA